VCRGYAGRRRSMRESCAAPTQVETPGFLASASRLVDRPVVFSHVYNVHIHTCIYFRYTSTNMRADLYTYMCEGKCAKRYIYIYIDACIV